MSKVVASYCNMTSNFAKQILSRFSQGGLWGGKPDPAFVHNYYYTSIQFLSLQISLHFKHLWGVAIRVFVFATNLKQVKSLSRGSPVQL